MAIRLHQMHPALVHLPITLLPLAVGADLLGRMSGDKSLLWFGQKAIGIAAADFRRTSQMQGQFSRSKLQKPISSLGWRILIKPLPLFPLRPIDLPG